MHMFPLDGTQKLIGKTITVNTSTLIRQISRQTTPWKIHMEPENDGLEDDVPVQLGAF